MALKQLSTTLVSWLSLYTMMANRPSNWQEDVEHMSNAALGCKSVRYLAWLFELDLANTTGVMSKDYIPLLFGVHACVLIQIATSQNARK